MRYHPQWAGATDYEVERGGSGMVAQNVSVSTFTTVQNTLVLELPIYQIIL